MFDLNKAIENWKSVLDRNEAFREEDIEELESHLREQIEQLIKSGLSGEEALLIARNRLGDPEEIGRQFAQADPSLLWKRRIFWMAVGVFSWFAVVLCQRVFSAVAILAAVSIGVRSGIGLGVANIIANVLFLLLILLGYLRMSRHGIPATQMINWSTWTSTRTRTSLCIIGVLLTGMLGKLFLAVPMVYASDVVPIQEMGRYAVYRTISGNLALALLTAAVVAFVFTQIARRHVSSTLADR